MLIVDGNENIPCWEMPREVMSRIGLVGWVPCTFSALIALFDNTWYYWKDTRLDNSALTYYWKAIHDQNVLFDVLAEVSHATQYTTKPESYHRFEE